MNLESDLVLCLNGVGLGVETQAPHESPGPTQSRSRSYWRGSRAVRAGMGTPPWVRGRFWGSLYPKGLSSWPPPGPCILIWTGAVSLAWKLDRLQAAGFSHSLLLNKGK